MSSYVIQEDGTVIERRAIETGPTVSPDSVCGALLQELNPPQPEPEQPTQTGD